MDKKSFRRKYLLGLLTSPLTLFPIGAGATGLVALAAAEVGMPMLWLASAGSILLGFGVLAQRAVCGSEKISHQAREEMLDELDKQLRTEDNDARPETALRDLRALSKAFRKYSFWKQAVNSYSVMVFLSIVGRTFEECVNSLIWTSELLKLANDISPERRKGLLERREEVIKSIEKSVQGLQDMLEKLHVIGAEADPSRKLSELGEELEAELEVAKRVKERMRSITSNGDRVSENEKQIL